MGTPRLHTKVTTIGRDISFEIQNKDRNMIIGNKIVYIYKLIQTKVYN